MDRELTHIEQSNQGKNWWVRLLLVGALIIAGLYFIRTMIRPSLSLDEVILAEVYRGSIENRISATGLTVPAFEAVINAPVATQIASVHLRAGDEVQINDRILTLNHEVILLQVESLQDELALKRNNVKRSAIDHEMQVRDLEYQDNILGLKIKSLRTELADLKHLQTVGGATLEEVEKMDLDLQVQELEKKKLENDLYFKKALFERDQVNLRLEVSIKEKDLAKLERKLNQTAVLAGTQGIITWVNSNIGEQVNEGSPLVRIADLSKFQIKGQISDRYSSILRRGQLVVVQIGEHQINARITSILPEVIDNTVEFNIEFAEDVEVALKPNMNVELFLVTEAKREALLVRNGPGYNGGRRFDFFKIEGKQARRVSANIGLVNSEIIELIDSPLEVGDRLIVSDMNTYEGVKKIKIADK